jgi:hypothetical protein
MVPKRGVYFLANDFVLDRAVAFLNSLRTVNPDVPLCLIPFDDDVDRLLDLQDRFGFTVWSGDPAVLDRCDEISRRFHGGRTQGHYRKLAAWEGRFDEFVYIDSDTVLLNGVDFLFRHLAEYAFVTAYSDLPEQRWLVWRDSVYESGVLTRRQIDYAAGTGLIASRKDCLRLDRDVLPRLAAAVELAPHMMPLTIEVPLLNYLMVTSGRPRTSLNLLRQAGFAVPQEHWAGLPITEANRSSILAVHWAGHWWKLGRGEIDELPHRELFEHYRWLAADQLVGLPRSS